MPQPGRLPPAFLPCHTAFKGVVGQRGSHVLRPGPPSGAEAAAESVPEVPGHDAATGCAESRRAQGEFAHGPDAQLPVQHRAWRLSHPVRSMPLPHGSWAPHIRRTVPPRSSKCAVVRHMRAADDGRTTWHTPLVRPKDGPVMAPRSTLTAFRTIGRFISGKAR